MINIGQEIRKLRLKNRLTLRALAQRTGLSIGFLSQLERGRTTVAIDSLRNISTVLGTDLNYFLSVLNNPEDDFKDKIIRSYERPVSLVEAEKFIHHYLSAHLKESALFPEIIILLPRLDATDGDVFSHQGEEFVYVLEGSLTVNYHGDIIAMRAGDGFLFNSTTPHNWYNSTLQITKILVVRHPNPFLAQTSEPESAPARK
ncbi:MAG: cupin domain-containing protein [Clostridiales Family XIII bacterium]|nr:cupin domain-containing protein [Clostridiales Family XIII bacterium]